MNTNELLEKSFSVVMDFSPICQDVDNVAMYAFLSSLEDAIMGYSLSELIMEEYSADNLLTIITDFNSGELIHMYHQDMMNKQTNETDYKLQLLSQVKKIVDYFNQEHLSKFSLIEDTYNIRDISTNWYGNTIIVLLTGERYRD